MSAFLLDSQNETQILIVQGSGMWNFMCTYNLVA